ncbi:hypothetical protein [Pseudactinotalea suaedae]|uniref:hypothetical protein n=1 Tax=Pseudactinotalea suaedae TaxID=1524924 RepID=UPI0019D626F1|nr:hypothetical protein [Pseudactinotalea suaedae]
MSTTTHTAPAHQRRALPTLWIGLALTLAVGVCVLLDGSTTQVLADHLRATYPAFGEEEVAAGAQTYVAILLTVTGLGAVGWLSTIGAARSGKTWTRWLATAALVFAVAVAAAGLTTVDTSGEVGLAPAMGWLLLLPCLPGLVAVTKLWRGGTRR